MFSSQKIFYKRLQEWETSFVSSLHSQIKMIGKVLEVEKTDESYEAAAAVAADSTVTSLLPDDAAVLDGLERSSSDFMKMLRGEFSSVVGRFMKIDLGALFAAGIGEVIRSFRAVDEQTLQNELMKFICSDLLLHESSVEHINSESDGEDFCLCLKVGARVGANVDGLVDGKTALMQAICATNMDVMKMVAEEGTDLKVKAGEAQPEPESNRDQPTTDFDQWLVRDRLNVLQIASRSTELYDLMPANLNDHLERLFNFSY
uniref:Uncharacterized protein n=1 Tax=Chromera velia CCMP2878 TaxID=1169474 RepID=A0A0G4HCJ3_9ALVE|eukprot:Cvel_26223.t1-p1 / transcript=Cvel_26223.t1 / gene=Cvel_26223 / organism=Chromera_velia_CCMP2878 / gene_product=hypothetical protein / transcript_product=hypothetical protein / location=Cvel_scaffold3091:6379-8580(+) / protein_length=259 / sequence_SO=supercontig / SO=protein_coding / is_pseudo=false